MFRYFFILFAFFLLFDTGLFAQNFRHLGMKASQEEIYKYYGAPGEEELEKEKLEKEKRKKIDCGCEKFELDHSLDELVHIDLWTGLQRTRSEGTIRLKGQNNNGETLNLIDDLEIEDKDGSMNFGVDLFFIGAHLGFSMNKSSFDGITDLERNYTIGDDIYNAGTKLESRIDYVSYRGILGYTGYVNKHFGIGFSLCIDYMRLDYRINDGTNSRKNSGDIEIYTPAFGFNIDWSPSDRWLFTFGTYGTWSDIADKEVWFFNPYARIRFFPMKTVYLLLKGGYRGEDYKLDESRVYINSDTGAWNISVGAGLRF